MRYYTTNLTLGHTLDMSTRTVFDKIIDNIQLPCDAIHTTVNNFHEIDNFKLNEKIVVIGVDDPMEYRPEYNWWAKTPTPELFHTLYQMASDRPDTTFVFLLPGRFWKTKHFAPLTNTRVIDFTLGQGDRSYHTVKAVEKNFESNKIGISLNRQMRVHRISLISLLYGLELDKSCIISAVHLYKQLSKLDSTEYLDHSDWQFDPEHDPIKYAMQRGFERIVSEYKSKENFQPRDRDVFITQPGTDIVIDYAVDRNFEEELRPLYQNSFVELVSNRLYSEPTVSIDEKMTNSVYGQNFPILIGSVGTVALYRDSGIDVFDDVVDHAYDNIANPIDRLYRAVVDNQHLFTDIQKTKQLWLDRQDRFEKNVAYCQEDLYNYYEQYILSECNREIPDLLTQAFDE